MKTRNILQCVALAAAAVQSSLGGEILNQDFSSSATVSSYVSPNPGFGQFTDISSETGGGTWSISSAGQLRLTRTGNSSASNGAGLTRHHGSSVSNSVLMVKFDLGVTGNQILTSALELEIGNILGFADYNIPTPASNVFARLQINLGGSTFKFANGPIISNFSFPANGTMHEVRLMLNNSGVAKTYRGPNMVSRTLEPANLDVWLGTTLIFNNMMSLHGASSNLDDIRFRFASTDNAGWKLDNFLVTDTLPNSIVGTNLESYAFTSNGTAGGAVVPVDDGPNFAKAWRIAVNAASANDSDVALAAPILAGVSKGDALLATFYYRRWDDDVEEADITATFKAQGVSGGRSITIPLRGRQQWRRISIPFQVGGTYSAGAAALEFHLGAREQQVDIGGIEVTKLGQRSVFGPNSTDASSSFAIEDTPYATKSTFATTDNLLFNSVTRLRVTADPPPAPYSVRMIRKIPVAVDAGDTFVAIFWMRDAAPVTGQLGVGGVSVAEFASPYASYLAQDSLSFDGNWKQHIIPFTVSSSYLADELQFSVKAGAQAQTLEIAGLQLLKLDRSISAATLTSTEFDYCGRSLKSHWRAEAEAGISANRKGSFMIKVTDGNGVPQPGIQVDAAMKKHQFGFGSAVDGEYLTNTSPNARRYQQEIKTLFNKVVLENELKWPKFETTSGRTLALDSIQWLRSNGIYDIRGHTLVWPDTSKCPPDVADLSGQTLTNRILNHIDAEVTDPGLKGYLCDWDVVNEPYEQRNLLDKMSGMPEGSTATVGQDAAIIKTWFTQAAADPYPLRFLNETGVSTDLVKSALHDYVLALLSELKRLETPIDGLGLQSHFRERPIPMVTAKTRFEQFTARVPMLQITEFDQESTDSALQADFLTDYMTLVFSLPYFDTFLTWGFWDGRHWRTNSPIFNKDWSLKPSGEAWMALVRKKWWTNTTSSSDSAGQATVEGFLGRYTLTASVSGVTKNYHVTLPKPAGTKLDIKLGGSAGTKNVWLHEPEQGAVYSKFISKNSTDAYGGGYITSTAGISDLNAPTAAQTRIDTEASGNVNIWLRVMAPNPASDSFWMNMDNGAWETFWVTQGAEWHWVKWKTVLLTSGTPHSIFLSVREGACAIDQVLLTDDLAFTP